MATVNSFGSNRSITLEKNKVITVTKRTVRFAKNVYQTHNITGFSEGEVDIGTIPWGIIIIVFILALIFGSFNGVVASSLMFAAIGGAFWNFVKPKHYGLLLTLNSGDQKLFITTDQENLKRVLEVVYEFIETEKDATYQISVNNSHVQGNFIQGYVGGSVLNSSDD